MNLVGEEAFQCFDIQLFCAVFFRKVIEAVVAEQTAAGYQSGACGVDGSIGNESGQILLGQQNVGNRTADGICQTGLILGDNTGGEGKGQTEQLDLLIRVKQHFYCDIVGAIADDGTDDRAGKVV